MSWENAVITHEGSFHALISVFEICFAKWDLQSANWMRFVPTQLVEIGREKSENSYIQKLFMEKLLQFALKIIICTWDEFNAMQSKIRIDFHHGSFMMLYIKAFLKGSCYFNDAQKLPFFSKQSFTVIKGSSNNPKCGNFAFWNVCVGESQVLLRLLDLTALKFSQTTCLRTEVGSSFIGSLNYQKPIHLILFWWCEKVFRVWRVLSRLWGLELSTHFISIMGFLWSNASKIKRQWNENSKQN